MRAMPVYAPVLLCLVGVLLSLEYKGEQYRTLQRVFQGLSLAMAAACALRWFIDFPNAAAVALSLAAILVNLPLAALGLKQKFKK